MKQSIMLFFLFISINVVYADNAVLSSKSLADISSKQWIEPFVQRVVFDAYQQFVRRVVKEKIIARVPAMTSPVAEQTFSTTTARALEHPEVLEAIQDVYALGLQEAVEQVKKKVTQSVLQREVERLVDRAINRLAVSPGFQQIVEQQVQWAKNIQTQRNIQHSYQQQQMNTAQKKYAQQQAAQQMQQQFIERLQKALADKKKH